MPEANQVLLTRREGAVLVLSNNNVAARNALSPEFYAAVSAALKSAATDPTVGAVVLTGEGDRKSTRLNSSHLVISYAVFCLKKKKKHAKPTTHELNTEQCVSIH